MRFRWPVASTDTGIPPGERQGSTPTGEVALIRGYSAPGYTGVARRVRERAHSTTTRSGLRTTRQLHGRQTDRPPTSRPDGFELDELTPAASKMLSCSER